MTDKTPREQAIEAVHRFFGSRGYSIAGQSWAGWLLDYLDANPEAAAALATHLNTTLMASGHQPHYIEALNAAAASRYLAGEEGLRAALREWKCPGCGGSGIYRWRDTEVRCAKCNGDGLHPTASAALAATPPRSGPDDPARKCLDCGGSDLRGHTDRCPWAHPDV